MSAFQGDVVGGAVLVGFGLADGTDVAVPVGVAVGAGVDVDGRLPVGTGVATGLAVGVGVGDVVEMKTDWPMLGHPPA